MSSELSVRDQKGEQNNAPAPVYMTPGMQAKIEAMQNAVKEVHKAAAPTIKKSGEQIIDDSIKSSEKRSKEALGRSVTVYAPSLAPHSLPIINDGVDAVGEQTRAALKTQVNRSVENDLHHLSDAGVIEGARSINSSQSSQGGSIKKTHPSRVEEILPKNKRELHVQEAKPASVYINSSRLASLQKGGDEIVKAAAPTLKKNGENAVDYSVNVSETTIKTALVGSVVTQAPSIAPYATPIILTVVDQVGKQARPVLKEQIHESVDTRLPSSTQTSIVRGARSTD